MQDFTAIGEKLKRAEENINNLCSEMDRFFQESDYPTFPENDRELHLQAIEYHRNRFIPPRFSVLAGEIIHHLRSCFDHVNWHFSVGPKINNMPVDFPVFLEEPIDKKDLARFEGKIQRITDTNVIALIKRIQPYNSPDPADNPLWLIHDFDIIDKHRELILCEGTPSIALPRSMQGVLEAYQKAHPELDAAQVARDFKSHATFQPCISFSNFGRREIEPVSEGLIKLFNYTVIAIEDFRGI
jgi:hypothetical protein